MKTVVRISMISAMLFALAGLSVNAQNGMGPKQGSPPGHGYPDSCRIQLMVDDMREPLSLSDNQVQQIEQIHYNHMEEAKELRRKYKNDCVGARDARKEMRDQVQSEVKDVLNEEQKKQFDAFLAGRRSNHGPHHGHNGKK